MIALNVSRPSQAVLFREGGGGSGRVRPLQECPTEVGTAAEAAVPEEDYIAVSSATSIDPPEASCRPWRA